MKRCFEEKVTQTFGTSCSPSTTYTMWNMLILSCRHVIRTGLGNYCNLKFVSWWKPSTNDGYIIYTASAFIYLTMKYLSLCLFPMLDYHTINSSWINYSHLSMALTSRIININETVSGLVGGNCQVHGMEWPHFTRGNQGLRISDWTI